MAWPEDDIDMDGSSSGEEPHAVGGGDIYPTYRGGEAGRILAQFFGRPKPGPLQDAYVAYMRGRAGESTPPKAPLMAYDQIPGAPLSGSSPSCARVEHERPEYLPVSELKADLEKIQRELAGMRRATVHDLGELSKQVKNLSAEAVRLNRELQQLRADTRTNHDRIAARIPAVELPAPQLERKPALSVVERFIGFVLRVAFWSIVLSFLLLLPMLLHHHGLLR